MQHCIITARCDRKTLLYDREHRPRHRGRHAQREGHDRAVTRIPEEVVRLQVVQILRREFDPDNNGNGEHVSREGARAPRGRPELRPVVALALELVLVPDHELEIPDIVQNEAVVDLLGETAHRVWELFQPADLQLAWCLEEQ